MAETLEKEDKKADSIEFYKQASYFLAPPKPRTHWSGRISWRSSSPWATASCECLAVQAADLFAGEEQTSEANKCRLKVLIPPWQP